jgi:aspartyl-tRNA(Asn)/glutamyl-tRNA(Gln) amidotransferase subunit C
MPISPLQINKLCTLAQLALRADELARVGGDLERIIGMIDAMGNVDTDGVAPLAHPLDAIQRLRDDVVTETVDRDLFQSIAPATENGYYLVPRVIE